MKANWIEIRLNLLKKKLQTFIPSFSQTSPTTPTSTKSNPTPSLRYFVIPRAPKQTKHHRQQMIKNRELFALKSKTESLELWSTQKQWAICYIYLDEAWEESKKGLSIAGPEKRKNYRRATINWIEIMEKCEIRAEIATENSWNCICWWLQMIESIQWTKTFSK